MKKNKALIVTVAGKATRFNQELIFPVLKCLYNEGDYTKSSLYLLLEKCNNYDKIIIVGGYLYDDLKITINKYFKNFINKIHLVKNEFFDKFGSGYSLICGILNTPDNIDEITFVEGDLIFDKKSFDNIVTSEKNVITYTSEPISADKSVVFYIDEFNRIFYEYDNNHKLLQIPFPLKKIFNSGQIWKFNNIKKLKEIINLLEREEIEFGNGLNLIEYYMNLCETNDIDIIQISKWYNCNTINDYKQALKSYEY